MFPFTDLNLFKGGRHRLWMPNQCLCAIALKVCYLLYCLLLEDHRNLPGFCLIDLISILGGTPLESTIVCVKAIWI